VNTIADDYDDHAEHFILIYMNLMSSSQKAEKNERVRSMAENIKSDDVRACIAMPIFYFKRKNKEKACKLKKNALLLSFFPSFHLLSTLLVM